MVRLVELSASRKVSALGIEEQRVNVIEQAITIMRRTRCRRLPVVDESGQRVGLLSLDDVLQLLAEELTNVGQLLERQAPQAAAKG